MLTACVRESEFGDVTPLVEACERLHLRHAPNVGMTFVEVPLGRLADLEAELVRIQIPRSLLFFIDCPSVNIKELIRSHGFKGIVGGRGRIIQVGRGLWGLGEWVPLWGRSEVVSVNYSGALNVPSDLLRTIDCRPNGSAMITLHRTDGGTPLIGVQSDTIAFYGDTEETVRIQPVDRRGRVRIPASVLALLGPPAARYRVADEWAWLSISPMQDEGETTP